MLNEWCECPLVELSIGVLHRHPLPWTTKKYWHGWDVIASDGVDVAVAVSERTAYGLVLWAQEVKRAGKTVKHEHVNAEDDLDD